MLHKRVTHFKAKNHQLKRSYWECLFTKSFHNLIELNLALSCNDDVLQLIAQNCPNLEYLNATCRYERVRVGSNANVYALSVSDLGLSYICDCRKLKIITINEPRSPTYGVKHCLTYAGLRLLLTQIPTIQDISYTDMGSVISKSMEQVETLNLRAIRHFSATDESIREIFRLCRNLEEIHLTFFNSENRDSIVNQLINSNLKLTTISLVNLNLLSNFDRFFETLGGNLVFLSIANSYQAIRFINLVTIGRTCPNLKYLKYNLIDNCHEYIGDVPSIGQFKQLESLYITGHEMNLEKVLQFCTENSVNLENLKINEMYTTMCVDQIFLKCLHAPNIQHIEISPKYTFTLDGVRGLLERFKCLNYLNIFCGEDCHEFMNDIRTENYDLTFINKVYIEELWGGHGDILIEGMIPPVI